MEQERRAYRRVRLLTGGVVPAVLAAALLVFAVRQDAAWEPAAQAAGICRELLAGSTEGRQALVGSCWVAPLPVLAYLPFAWLLPEPFAGWAAFFCVWLFVFWGVREAVKAVGQPGWRIVLAQGAAAALMTVGGGGRALGLAPALTAGLALLAGAGLADWAAYRRLRDVVVAGAASALLLLCGFPLFAPAALAVAALPLAACGHRETRGRAGAWLLLGGLPPAYALGVWLLMNRLVLGDPFFFLRALGPVTPRPGLLALALAPPALALVLALAAACWLEARRDRPGAGDAGASALLVAFAVVLLGTSHALARFGLAWGGASLAVCAPLLLMAALARLRQPAYRLALALGLFVWLGRSWFVAADSGARQGPAHAEICREVEAYVNGRTPYGRVFALGYAGLELLRGYGGERIVPNLDLHIGALRRAYKGQNLYVLVPAPVGAARAESVFWRYPEIHANGFERLLFAEAFGTWHLFEVVTAPTQEQLDEWRKAP